MEDWKSWSIEKLEHQMSPSRWNPNKSPDDVIEQFIATCSAETERARQEIPNKLDIPYGKLPSQKYDLYGTDLSKDAPIVLWIHGGYWQESSKDISATVALNLHKIGIKAIILGYTLAPQASIKQIQEEVLTALKQVVDEFPAAKVLVGGHSAGAYLSAALLHHEAKELNVEPEVAEKISGLLLFAGVYDLRPLVPTYVNDALKLTQDEAERLSILQETVKSSHIKKDIMIVVSVGGWDSPEFIRQSKEYLQKLKPEFENVHLHMPQEDDHFTLIENLSSLSESSSGGQLQKTLQGWLESQN